MRLVSNPGCVTRGQTPAESDFQLLEVGRRLEMYGVRLHPAKDREGTKLSLAVAHTGVLVFQVSRWSLEGGRRSLEGRPDKPVLLADVSTSPCVVS